MPYETRACLLPLCSSMLRVSLAFLQADSTLGHSSKESLPARFNSNQQGTAGSDATLAVRYTTDKGKS